MNKNEVMAILSNKKKGQFIRLSAVTPLDDKVSAKMRLLYKVEKIGEGTYKWGCKLQNVERYKTKEANRTTPKREMKPWAHWIIPDVLKEHNETGRVYLSLITVPNHHNSRSKYRVTNRETGEVTIMTKEQLKASGIMVPSFFNRSESEVVTFPIENIIKIY